MIVLPEDEATAEVMRAAVVDRKRGGYCRMIMVNPLNRQLPKLAFITISTCNKFTAADVGSQWKRLRALWNRPNGLGTILGPLIGNGSDGDARRALLQLEQMTATAGTRYEFPWSGMTLTARVEEDGSVSCIHAQDTIH